MCAEIHTRVYCWLLVAGLDWLSRAGPGAATSVSRRSYPSIPAQQPQLLSCSLAQLLACLDTQSSSARISSAVSAELNTASSSITELKSLAFCSLRAITFSSMVPRATIR